MYAINHPHARAALAAVRYRDRWGSVARRGFLSNRGVPPRLYQLAVRLEVQCAIDAYSAPRVNDKQHGRM